MPRCPPRSSLFPYTTLFRSLLDWLTPTVSGPDGQEENRLPAISRWKIFDNLRRSLVENFPARNRDRKSTRLNSSHVEISYAVFCLKKKKETYVEQHSYYVI